MDVHTNKEDDDL